MNYSEKLKHPNWQKKRLEILSRDKFKCVVCGDSESMLSVHHCYYERSREPWEYPNLSLKTLCQECHREETENMYSSKTLLLRALSEKGLLSADFNDLAVEIATFNKNIGNFSDFLTEFLRGFKVKRNAK